ncbi:MAG: cytidylate kinase-like family protein [Candidatus Glassbacteria bacterium]|nr:cytidylate kinase-like family protein [Candidatus Glassbacteria bacterium]
MEIRIKEVSKKDRLKQVEEQFRSWEVLGTKAEAEKAEKKTTFVTISREYGCAAFRIGNAVAEALNAELRGPSQIPWAVYDRKLVDLVCEDHKLNRTLVETLDRQRKHVFSDYITGIFTGEPSSIKVFKKCASTIFSLASHGRVILIGRASSLITEKLAGGLHVRIVAPLDWRVEQVAAFEKIDSPGEARRHVQKMDAEREKFASDFLGRSVNEPDIYHMVLNQKLLGIEGIVELILKAFEAGK